MTYRPSALLAALSLSLAGLVAPLPATAVMTDVVAAGTPTVAWKSCPEYSPEVIRALGVTEEQVTAFHTLMDRLQCGTLSVPLDHARPNGRKIDIALTRLAATDTKHRLGATALLPGGPGNSSYLGPVLHVMLRNNEMARLNQRYDLIGFDPRGVGYSTKVACTTFSSGKPVPGPLTEDSARKIYDTQVAANQACANSDPAFLGQLTTENLAKDLDLIRTAMGERELSLLGLSYGARLGMIYRGMYPGRTNRAFLDSVPPPWTRLDEHVQGSAGAAERDFGRMAAWLARTGKTSALGSTTRQIRDTVAKLVRDYDDNPKSFTDLPRTIDGAAVANLARRNSTEWARAGQALAELLDTTGTTAPLTVKELFGSQSAPLPGQPEMLNMTMNRAVKCNEDTSRIGFAAAWDAYQKRVRQHPATGRVWGLGVECPGWPLPVKDTPVKRAKGSLVLSGHLHEFMSIYDWTLQTRRAIGGTVYTVADDVHVSATRVPECAADVVKYFNTGRIDAGCKGSQPRS